MTEPPVTNAARLMTLLSTMLEAGQEMVERLEPGEVRSIMLSVNGSLRRVAKEFLGLGGER